MQESYRMVFGRVERSDSENGNWKSGKNIRIGTRDMSQWEILELYTKNFVFTAIYT